MKTKIPCLTVGLSPAIQKTLIFKDFREGEVNRSEKYHSDASGKCINVCRVLTQGGIKASCLTVAGKENLSGFESLCRRDSLDVTLVETSGRVRFCTTIVDLKNRNSTELVVNEPEIITAEEEEIFKKAFQKKMEEGYRSVVISGSRFEGFSEKIIPFMVKEAKKQNCLVVADYRKEDLKNSFISPSVHPDYIKINEEEFFETFGDQKNLEEGLKEISSEYHCVFIISRGARPTLVAESGRIFTVESSMIEAVNPIGCGDAMTAGLTQGILEGLPLKEAIEKGRDYAALNALNIHPGYIRKKTY